MSNTVKELIEKAEQELENSYWLDNDAPLEAEITPVLKAIAYTLIAIAKSFDQSR